MFRKLVEPNSGHNIQKTILQRQISTNFFKKKDQAINKKNRKSKEKKLEFCFFFIFIFNNSIEIYYIIIGTYNKTKLIMVATCQQQEN